MKISNKYLVVERLEEEKKEGFTTVDVQDNFVCKGRVTYLPEIPVHMVNEPVKLGDIVLFAKYSPDTQEVELEGKKLKFIRIEDILALI